MDVIYSRLKLLQSLKKNRSNWNISWNLCSFLSNFIELNKPKFVLEVGTSNGFSGLCILKYLPCESSFYTVEINKDRFLEAKKNFSGIKNKKIFQINENVFDFLESFDKKIKFDFIFIDAAQSFYKELVEKLLEKELLLENFTIIFDNVLSHGNMNNFLEYMNNNFECQLIEIDSGFLIARNKTKLNN